MRRLVEAYPKTTAYIAAMVTLLVALQVWEMARP